MKKSRFVTAPFLIVGLLGMSQPTAAPIEVASFNVQFLGHFKYERNDGLAEFLNLGVDRNAELS